ncbi:hypothetical protein COLO4_29067 [Corchorus olitorius]|uniref:Uncharacterized protein n=1 Tax=Corchorus olitorius TaxID=93759 RepID=A0A1R3HGD7_9ROSI|nr:hypothetical protein COLO4_29067 [Corchorus olitorius]
MTTGRTTEGGTLMTELAAEFVRRSLTIMFAEKARRQRISP